MPAQFTLPPDTRAVGTGNPPADMNAVADALTAMGAGLNVLNAAYAGGADPTGVTDSTAALQAAVTAAVASGRALCVPAGTYLTGPLTVTGDLKVTGEGWGSVFRLKAGSNGYVFTFSPPGGGIRADFRNLAINGNAENQTSGGCIYAAGAVQSRFDNLYLYDAYDVCLWLYQIGSGTIGHHNRVTRCLFDTLNTVASANQQGIRLQGSDENYIAFCDFENWGGLAGTPGSNPDAIRDLSGIQVIIGNVFVGGQQGVNVSSASSTRVIGNTFDGVGRAGVAVSGSKNVIMGNLFSDASSAGAGSYAQCEVDNSSSAIVTGNAFTVGTTGMVRNCVRELSSSSHKTLVTGNVIDVSGTLYGGNTPVELLGTNSDARSNPGFNPKGPISAPSVPATTVAYVNNFRVDATVHVTGGTVTAIAVGGTVTGLTSGTFRVPADQSITLTYSAAPSWTWFGD